jgi:hypothetical protein
MDNSNYIPKKLNSNNRNIQISKPNEDLDIHNNCIFPTLPIHNVSTVSPVNNLSINWKNITKDLENEPIIKELEKNNKESIQINLKQDISQINNTINKQKKVKSIFVDDSGWTHVVKSTKSKYKEKKKKDNPDIDELIKNVISF